MARQIGLKFDEGLLARVDAAALAAGVDRSAYIRMAVEVALEGPGGAPVYTPPVGSSREPKPFVRYSPEELEARRQRHRLAFGCELANFQVRDEVDADRMRKLLGEDRRC